MAKINHRLFLIGFSGSGKSTVGPLVAIKLGVRFADVDSVIEKNAGCSIPEIFAEQGENQFRHLEQEAVHEVIQSKSAYGVVALGGGAFESSYIRDIVARNGNTVYLSCAADEIYRRLKRKSDRPLLQVESKSGKTLRSARLRRIGKLLTARKLNYGRADWAISTTRRSPQEVAEIIVARFLKESKA